MIKPRCIQLTPNEGVLGGLAGGWLIDSRRKDGKEWHWILSSFLVCCALAFVAFTQVTTFWGLLLSSLLWGWSSTVPSLSTQAAMTWLYPPDRVSFWLQLNNAAFGVGALVAPVLVSIDLHYTGSFYWVRFDFMPYKAHERGVLSLIYLPPGLLVHSCCCRSGGGTCALYTESNQVPAEHSPKYY